MPKDKEQTVEQVTHALLSLFFIFPLLCCQQVPFGPLAFIPGKLVHTNEITVLLGDNWFTKCSAKQAQKLVDHRMKCESNSFRTLQ